MKKNLFFCFMLTAVIAVLFSGCSFMSINIPDNPVNEKEFLGNKINPTDIYEKKSDGKFYSPFNAKVNYMENLILVNLDDDPVYEGFEAQTFKDKNGTGILILAYKKDKKIDIYYDSDGYDFSESIKSGKQLFGNKAAYYEAKLNYILEYDQNKLRSYADFKDIYGKKIEWEVTENIIKEKDYGILAPIGDTTEEPVYFPFIYLEKFKILYQENTKITVKIDGREQKLTTLPVPVNGKSSYLTRYSLKPVIVNWNYEYKGSIIPIAVNEQLSVKNEGITYSLINNKGNYEISKITAESGENYEYFSFVPAVPDILSLKDKSIIKGKFSAGCNERTGVIGGDYVVMRNGNKFTLQMQPSSGWQPTPGELWFKTYTWDAEFEVKDNDVFLNSSWYRNSDKRLDIKSISSN